MVISQFFIALAACLVAGASAFVPQQQQNIYAQRFDTSCNALTVPGMWGAGLNFGKGDFAFYKSFDSFMKPFTDEDRQAFPEIFNIPKGCEYAPNVVVFVVVVSIL